MFEVEGSLFMIGALLTAGVIGGTIAKWFHLPKLTGYLAAGILVGHQGLDLLPHEQVDALSVPVNELAMALVLFVLGGQFHFSRIRDQLRSVLTLSGIEALLTFSLVALLTWPVLGSFSGAILLGVMAIAVAPATTVEVLREYRAEGPVSEGLRLLTALSNIWAVLLFEIALLFLFALSGLDASPWDAAWDIAGALLYGVIAGHVLILMQEKIGRGNYSVALLTTLLLTIGLCQTTGVPHMLAMLVTGAVVVNRSRFFTPVVASMEHFAQPAYVAFFVLSGMHLDFHVLIDNWLAASLYIVARVLGKVVGTRIGLTGLKEPPQGFQDSQQPPLGLGLLCQAGAAIALASLAREYDEELGNQLLNIILGAVVVFELLGPILVRHVAIASGEVRMAELLTQDTPPDERSQWARLLRRAFRGRDVTGGTATLDTLLVEQIMRRGVRTLPSTARLDEVLKFANQSPFNHFPAVDSHGALVGMIALHDLQDLAYDPRLGGLVIAEDLATTDPVDCALPQTATLAEAAEFFQNYAANTAAVVEQLEKPVLVGMLERAEVLRLVRSLHEKTAGATQAPAVE